MVRRTIGIRDAKSQLSRLLKDVQQGAEWIITDHGTPVAKIAPLTKAEQELDERIAALVRRGWIEPARPGARIPIEAAPVSDDVAQNWLAEDRDR